VTACRSFRDAWMWSGSRTPSSRTVEGHDVGARQAACAASSAERACIARLASTIPSWVAAASTVPAVAVRINASPAATWSAVWPTHRREVKMSTVARAQFEIAESSEFPAATAATSS